jgi:hypothetical protein
MIYLVAAAEPRYAPVSIFDIDISEGYDTTVRSDDRDPVRLARWFAAATRVCG